MEQLKTMFNCKICSKLLIDPVVVSCENTVCQSHLKDYIGHETFECQCCKREHKLLYYK